MNRLNRSIPQARVRHARALAAVRREFPRAVLLTGEGNRVTATKEAADAWNRPGATS